MNAKVNFPQKKISTSILFDAQIDDVHDALHRFFVANKKGKLFTNAPGTGKTHMGCGVIKAFCALNKLTILVVAPYDGILLEWQRSLTMHGLSCEILTTSEEKIDSSIVLMTYASFRQSTWLLKYHHDLLILDECHHLMSNEKGEETNGVEVMRALVGHPKGVSLRARIQSKSKAESYHKKAALHTKVLMTSATPWATHKCVDYTEGLLFDYPEKTSNGYRTSSGKDQFFIENFGYGTRCSRLIRPDVGVDVGLMEKEFHKRLLESGALSYRPLTVQTDYSREFINVESAIGARIDAGLQKISEGNYPWLKSIGAGIIHKLRQRQLLEAVKARAAIPRIKQHLALGRKVVVYHSFHQEEFCQPFNFQNCVNEITDSFARESAQKEYDQFKADNPELIEMNLESLKPTVETLVEAFAGNVGVVNGRVSKPSARKAVSSFKAHDGISVLVVQERAGREGYSFHDTDGSQPRALLQLGLPVDPVSCIQIEGRIRRYGSASNAIYEYFNTGTTFEINTFAKLIAERSETVENMACGNYARRLKASFIAGYLNSTDEEPHLGQGTGGVADEMESDEQNIWDKAISRFYSKGKRHGLTRSAEGEDFFATPAPVGLFMTLLARLKKGNSMLEPSSGEGDIAMWCPKDVKLTCVEKSYELHERLQLFVNRRATFRNESFEDFSIINKAHAVIMNPPFGKGGKLAAEHIKKACKHTQSMGRVIAIVPDSEQMDKRIENLIKELKDEKIRMEIVKTFSLPSVTFSRSGTTVKTKIVMLYRVDLYRPDFMNARVTVDFSNCESESELFAKMREYADEHLSNQDVNFEAEPCIKPVIDLESLPVIVKRESNVIECDFGNDKVIPLKRESVQLSLFG